MLPSSAKVRAGLAIFLLALSACGAPEVSRGINDPYEADNRVRHEANKRGDTRTARPMAMVYGETLPEPVRIGIGNFSSNLSLPGYVLNDLLQLRIEDALHNTARFLFNSTIGIAGIFDPAATIDINARETDFGETLYRWRFPEGHYVELPFVGPSTQRDALGKLVDLVIDPLNYAVPRPERYIGTVAAFAARLGDRYRFRTTVDSILYESADSYAQARLLYLEQRRFQLQGASDDDSVDPYEDPYAE